MGDTLSEEIGSMLEKVTSEIEEEPQPQGQEQEIEDEDTGAGSTEDEEDEKGAETEEEEEVPKEEPSAGEPEEEKPEEEPDGEKSVEEPDELADLRAQMNKMSELLLNHGIALPGAEAQQPPAGQPQATPQQPAQPDAQQPMSLEELAILDEDVDFEDVTSDRETFVKTIRSILGRYRDLLAQDFTRAIPTIVSNQVRQVSTLTNAVNEFYKENEDLVPVRKTVGAVANQVVAEHPDWDLSKVFEESATRTRKLLKIKKPSTGKGKVVKPSFASPKGKGGQRKPKQKISKVQREIDELIS